MDNIATAAVVVVVVVAVVHLFHPRGQPGMLDYRTPNCTRNFWAWMLPRVPGRLTIESSSKSQATWVIKYKHILSCNRGK